MKKVLSINYDKKDCMPVECPECHQMIFSVFKVSQKAVPHESHLHVRCIFCDLTWCLEEKPVAVEAGQ